MVSVCAAALAATGTAILPARFAGWSQSAPAQTISDGANADVLQEYGLKDSSTASYTHGPEKLLLRAWRFDDATGAYGAFTFYRQSRMKSISLGKGGAEGGGHFVFWTGATVIDAAFSAGDAPDRAALQALAAGIRQPFGSAGVAPSLPHYLPATALDASSVRYAIGPVAYAHGGGALPANAVGFAADAEAVTAQYASRDGKGTLTLLMYPTPQIAAEQARTIGTLLKHGGVRGGSVALQEKRSGPLVSITSGDFTQDEARHLLEQVKFADYLTVNRTGSYVSEAAKTAKLLTGIATLTVVLGAAAIFLGIFFGGGRAMIRVLRGKPASTLNDEQFISLKLNEDASAPAGSARPD
uniref:Uncharacterized protein n=2 Tax=Paracidobacterium acidisoli TaxID=2303751 RepID=A0A372IN37_9BACT